MPLLINDVPPMQHRIGIPDRSMAAMTVQTNRVGLGEQRLDVVPMLKNAIARASAFTMWIGLSALLEASSN